jgi:hypothetical protein
MAFNIHFVAVNAQRMFPSQLRVDFEGAVLLETEQPLVDFVLMLTQSKWFL